MRFTRVCVDYNYINFSIVYEFSIGKTVSTNKNDVNIGEKTVLRLASKYFFTNRNIVYDNFFSSIPLAIKLTEKNLTCIGTIRACKVIRSNRIKKAFLSIS